MSTRTFKRNGGGPSRARTKAKKKAKVWKNINGHSCKSQFTAYISSLAIARHWVAECTCTAKKAKCKATQRYGLDLDTWGSKANVTLPANIMPPK